MTDQSPTNTQKRSPATPNTIYYDKECSMCQAFVGKISNSNNDINPDLQDYHTATLPKLISKQEAAKALHYVGDDGVIYRGARAVFKIMEKQNKMKWLARLGQLPVIAQVSDIIYKIIADHRHEIKTTIR